MWKTGRRERGWRDTTRDTRVKNWGESEFKKKSEGWKERGWRAKQLKDGYNDRMIDKMI